MRVHVHLGAAIVFLRSLTFFPLYLGGGEQVKTQQHVTQRLADMAVPGVNAKDADLGRWERC